MFSLFGLQMIFTSLFLAMGKAKEGAFLSMARQGIFFFPIIIILPKLIGLDGVLYAQAVADLFTNIFTAFLGFKLYSRIQLNTKLRESVLCNAE